MKDTHLALLDFALLRWYPPPYGLCYVVLCLWAQNSSEFTYSPSVALCNLRVVSKRTFLGTFSGVAACRNWSRSSRRVRAEGVMVVVSF